LFGFVFLDETEDGVEDDGGKDDPGVGDLADEQREEAGGEAVMCSRYHSRRIVFLQASFVVVLPGKEILSFLAARPPDTS